MRLWDAGKKQGGDVHPEFISASIEHRHAELVSASLVKERFRVRPGMTAAGSE